MTNDKTIRAEPRAAEPRELAAFCIDAARLNADELGAMHYLMSKLLAGNAKHGPLDLDTDQRDWDAETLEEQADAAFYQTFKAIQRRRGLL